ncbi:hypothetical protein Pmani_006490 [Petrolisthes manimaculis]|uniref:Uncharacterized protein n=1 Tax=Petrolisthes manimaculis TaxID=1843537 RepID=A0AAE1QAX9_9EUCA|nr:hypothetical protein Pmani_006490 [Petrolisthes manimaculis]
MPMTEITAEGTIRHFLNTLVTNFGPPAAIEELHHSIAELFFGEDLIPRQVTTPNANTSNLSFIPDLKAAISSTRPTQTRKSNSRTFYTPPGLHVAPIAAYRLPQDIAARTVYRPSPYYLQDERYSHN